jgi:hypothetical protein
MTRLDLASLAQVPERTVYRWLSGEHRVPASLIRLMQIMVALELSTETVLKALDHID